MLASGRVYEQLRTALDETAAFPPSPSTCVCPTGEQADSLATCLRERVSALASIGCGEGAMEAMLEARGITVHAVDVDVLTDTSKYATMRCFCSRIHRVRPDALYLLPEPATTALGFFWGRALPWRAYLLQYPQVPVVCIAGEPAGEDAADCATEPRAGALDQTDGWRRVMYAPIRAARGGAMLSVYERVSVGVQVQSGH